MMTGLGKNASVSFIKSFKTIKCLIFGSVSPWTKSTLLSCHIPGLVFSKTQVIRNVKELIISRMLVTKLLTNIDFLLPAGPAIRACVVRLFQFHVLTFSPDLTPIQNAKTPEITKIRKSAGKNSANAEKNTRLL